MVFPEYHQHGEHMISHHSQDNNDEEALKNRAVHIHNFRNSMFKYQEIEVGVEAEKIQMWIKK